jgi:hypothetical protein
MINELRARAAKIEAALRKGTILAEELHDLALAARITSIKMDELRAALNCHHQLPED